MNPLNQGSSSSAPPVANDLVEKRKRGRPRKENSQVTPNMDVVDLVGQRVHGEVEGSIDKEGTGYILNVKVKDSNTRLKGVVFWTDKVPPVTPENDVAPHVKMYAREENNQTGHPQPDQTPNDQPTREENNQTGHPQSDLPPNDQPTTDDVTDLEISESAGAKSLVVHQSKGVEEEAAPSSQELRTLNLIEKLTLN